MWARSAWAGSQRSPLDWGGDAGAEDGGPVDRLSDRQIGCRRLGHNRSGPDPGENAGGRRGDYPADSASMKQAQGLVYLPADNVLRKAESARRNDSFIPAGGPQAARPAERRG